MIEKVDAFTLFGKSRRQAGGAVDAVPPLPRTVRLIPNRQSLIPAMDIATLRRYLDDPAAAEPWLRSLGRGRSEAGARQPGAAWPRPA